MMVGVDLAFPDIRTRIIALEEELGRLKAQLVVAEGNVSGSATHMNHGLGYETTTLYKESDEQLRVQPLDLEAYKRYGRQMILPEVGIDGQPLAHYDLRLFEMTHASLYRPVMFAR